MITIHVKSEKISGTIEFTDISGDDYRKLLEFVENLEKQVGFSEVEKVLLKNLCPQNENTNVNGEGTENSQESHSDGESLPKSNVPVGTKNDKLQKDYEAFCGIIDYAKEHPEEYEFRPVFVREFSDEHPEELGNISENTIGRFASRYGMERVVVTDKNRTPRRMRSYPMKRKGTSTTKTSEDNGDEKGSDPKVSPLNLEETNTDKKWGEKQGKILRDKRRQVDLTIQELSQLIGYPFYAIQAWENGSALPSPEAINALCKKFGNKLKSELGYGA